jgi:hypothetical protein
MLIASEIWLLSTQPQTCHKIEKPNSENGGFLRVTADSFFVAGNPKYPRFLSIHLH